MALIKSSVVGSFEGAQGIILREGTSGAVSVNVYKTKATTATDVDATQIATREIKMTGGYTPNYDNIISFEDGTLPFSCLINTEIALPLYFPLP